MAATLLTCIWTRGHLHPRREVSWSGCHQACSSVEESSRAPCVWEGLPTSNLGLSVSCSGGQSQGCIRAVPVRELHAWQSAGLGFGLAGPRHPFFHSF